MPGTLHDTGQILTDIGFIGTQMYGTTFPNLFTVSTATGASTLVGTYGAQAGGGMNALVGNGSSLLGASFANNTVFNINPANAALSNFATSPPRLCRPPVISPSLAVLSMRWANRPAGPTHW